MSCKDSIDHCVGQFCNVRGRGFGRSLQIGSGGSLQLKSLESVKEALDSDVLIRVVYYEVRREARSDRGALSNAPVQLRAILLSFHTT